MERPEYVQEAVPEPRELWLGYDRLVIPFEMINALLVYQPIWDRRIEQSYGTVPAGIRSVVLLHDGRVLPSSRALADLHARWVTWQQTEPTRDKPLRQDEDSTDQPQ